VQTARSGAPTNKVAERSVEGVLSSGKLNVYRKPVTLLTLQRHDCFHHAAPPAAQATR
jgi:hypothetical protein